MLKRYAFFPGCVLNAAASEARTALEASAKLLDVDLVEIAGGNTRLELLRRVTCAGHSS